MVIAIAYKEKSIKYYWQDQTEKSIILNGLKERIKQLNPLLTY